MVHEAFIVGKVSSAFQSARHTNIRAMKTIELAKPRQISVNRLIHSSVDIFGLKVFVDLIEMCVELR